MSILRSSQQERVKENDNNNNKDVIYKFYELDNVGHCPNHEAPQAVASTLYNWIYHTIDKNNNNDNKKEKKEEEEEEVFYYEPWGDTILREVKDIHLNFIDNLLTSFFIK